MQSSSTIWQALHSPVQYNMFASFYDQICQQDGNLSCQRFQVVCRQFTTYSEEYLQQFFEFFDLYNKNSIDCQSFFIIIDLMVSVTLNTRLLFLFSHQAGLIPYLQEEQNSSYLSRQRLIDLAILQQVPSLTLLDNLQILKDQLIQTDIKMAFGFLFNCLQETDNLLEEKIQ
ncbi:hypothetical protein SS50377_21210 [Spironucleus salmonicida]|uniref:EF-hand domain-containing protein n=1 Tax=Spironucleus salmonicida TaxID=348837 RepID=V6LT65_9EUKA|nr:hypothetical protein SS50377_21210 [Spironucleus salmonicida]|eukprot:EST43984.1 hypothetical protein SS50377_16292 [Spironucleus salmonicida]